MREEIKANKCSCGRWPVTYISIKTHKQYMKCHNCFKATRAFGTEEKKEMINDWNIKNEGPQREVV